MRNSFRVRYLLLLIAILPVLAIGCISIDPVPAAPAVTPTVTPTETASPTPPATNPINPTWTAPLPCDSSIALPCIADVVAKVKPSVVAINTEVISMDFFSRPTTQQGAGSGWIIDAAGIIVTNNHVIEGAQTITATLQDGTSYNADMSTVFTDPLTDLAIFSITAAGPLPALEIGRSENLRVGDWVVAIGNPLGLGISAKEGIVSRRGVTLPVSSAQTLYGLMETSAAINPGNSGGPLVNLGGEVIGITSAKISLSGVEGMGYAISTETALPVLEELIRNGYVTRPWLGVYPYTVDASLATRYGLPADKGALVVEVAPGGPADIIGLKPGDVVASLNGEEVITAEEFIRMIHSLEIGKPASITYWTDAGQQTREITPRENPPPG